MPVCWRLGSRQLLRLLPVCYNLQLALWLVPDQTCRTFWQRISVKERCIASVICGMQVRGKSCHITGGGRPDNIEKCHSLIPVRDKPSGRYHLLLVTQHCMTSCPIPASAALVAAACDPADGRFATALCGGLCAEVRFHVTRFTKLDIRKDICLASQTSSRPR